jgi:hypothetical protein
MTIGDITSQLVGAYEGFLSILPPFFQSFFNMFFLALLIFVYAIFVWGFHRFVSRKNIFNLDLNKYNTAKHPVLIKIIATGFYILEYIVILPILIFFWFSIFGIFLIILTEIEIATVLVISAVIIAAIRITAYSHEPAAREIAKLLPLTLLVTFILSPGFFQFQRVLSNINQIPEFFSTILNYLLFIIILELLLRLFEMVFSFLDTSK